MSVDISTEPAGFRHDGIGALDEAGTGAVVTFAAVSNRTYAVEFRDSFSGGSWGVLTNIPALPANTTIHITNAIVSPQRFFRARTP